MPCWEVNTISVNFKAKYKNLLIKAVEAIGIQNQYAYGWYEENGMFCIKNLAIDLEKEIAIIPNKEANDLLNKIRRSYSNVILQEVAKKKKWAIKNLAENKIELRRY